MNQDLISELNAHPLLRDLILEEETNKKYGFYSMIRSDTRGSGVHEGYVPRSLDELAEVFKEKAEGLAPGESLMFNVNVKYS